jgi:SAM-dependent methyltransferase
MNKFIFLSKHLCRGKSVTRAFLDYKLRTLSLTGAVLDLGAGKNDMYSKFIPSQPGSTYSSLDQKLGSSIDFETDALPYKDGSFDTILLLNVLEHIYNHGHLLREIRRIKRVNGELIGFVPFLMWYHPDPHDFFRYTHESLTHTLANEGYRDIKVDVVSNGPYTAAFQMIYPTLPRFLRAPLFALFYVADHVFRRLRKNAVDRYALGYIFRAK